VKKLFCKNKNLNTKIYNKIYIYVCMNIFNNFELILFNIKHTY